MMRVLFSALLLTAGSICYANPNVNPPIQAGNFYYVSSELPIDLSTGLLIDGDIQMLTTQVLTNIKKILHTVGLNLHDIVRTDVYLTDIRNYEAMNSAYTSLIHFTPPPAMDVTEVANLPSNASIAISCIAFKNSGN